MFFFIDVDFVKDKFDLSVCAKLLSHLRSQGSIESILLSVIFSWWFCKLIRSRGTQRQVPFDKFLLKVLTLFQETAHKHFIYFKDYILSMSLARLHYYLIVSHFSIYFVLYGNSLQIVTKLNQIFRRTYNLQILDVARRSNVNFQIKWQMMPVL